MRLPRSIYGMIFTVCAISGGMAPLFLSACGWEIGQRLTSRKPTNVPFVDSQRESLGVLKQGYVKDYGRWRKAAYVEIGGMALFGDRFLSPGDFREEMPEEEPALHLYEGDGLGGASTSLLWPDMTILYKYESNLDERVKEAFLKAVTIYENLTPLRFVEASSTATHQIVIGRSAGEFEFVKGYASIGFQNAKILPATPNGGYLNISHREPLLSDPYLYAVVLHELGHVIGLFHEMERPDRDDWMMIENVSNEDQETYLVKMDPAYGDIYDNRAFDFNSLMNYGPFHFWLALDKSKPIIRKKATSDVLFAPNTHITQSDLRSIRKLYAKMNAPDLDWTKVFIEKNNSSINGATTADINLKTDSNYVLTLSHNETKEIPFVLKNADACGSVQVLTPTGNSLYDAMIVQSSDEENECILKITGGAEKSGYSDLALKFGSATNRYSQEMIRVEVAPNEIGSAPT